MLGTDSPRWAKLGIVRWTPVGYYHNQDTMNIFLNTSCAIPDFLLKAFQSRGPS